MTDTTAISGTRRQYKEMADGTLRVQIDIDPQYKQQFLELFPQIDMPVALAPLRADFEQPKEEEKPKGGPLSKSAAQMCEHQMFQSFVKDRFWSIWKDIDCDYDSTAAAETLRHICGVESRAELDHNPQAAKRFHELMREYREWNAGKPVQPGPEAAA